MRKHKHWSAVITLIFFGVASSLLAGESPAPATPKRGGLLRLARPFDPKSLDLAWADASQDLLLEPLLYQPLLDITNGTTVVNNLTRDWQVSPDGLIYTFHLRPGVQFSNGRTATAQDYVFSLERIIEAGVMAYPLAGIRGSQEFEGRETNGVKHVFGLRAPAEDTFVVELTKPDATFRFLLAQAWGMALAREGLSRPNDRTGAHAIGAGPYVLKEWVRGARLRLVRNPHYFRPERQFFDEIDILIGGDESTHLMMFERGELDVANIMGVGVPLADYSRLSRDPHWASCLEREPLFNNIHLILNTEMPPLDNVKVRQAISAAIDREGWARLNPHLVTVARGVISPNMPGFDASLPVPKRDVERAKQLLREANFPSDSGKTITLVHYQTQHHTRWAARIQSDLKAVGIKVELKGVNNSLFGEMLGTRTNVPMALEDWTASLPDPKDFLENTLHSRLIKPQYSLNAPFYASEEFDALVDAASSSLDESRRLALDRQAEQVVLRDAPWVCLGHRNILALRQPWLKGNLIEPLWWYRFDRVWIER